MTLEQLEELFVLNEYDKIPSNLPEFTIYFHRENQGINVLHVIDYRDGLYISTDQYDHLKEKIKAFFQEKGEREIHIMSLILSDDFNKAKKLCVTDRFCWMIDTAANRLIIHENQVSDFYGWKGLLEDFLVQISYRQEKPQGAMASKSDDRDKPKRIKNLPWVTISLVVINIIVFLICTFTGDVLYNKGAFSVMDIIEDQAYYRMLTCMFLHADVGHLFSNMIVLYYVGEMVEDRLGHIPYGALYFLSGMAGDVFSMGYELLTGSYVRSVGASGAVFGVEGALLLLILLHHGKIESMTAGRVAFAIAFSLYCGFTSAGINNAAHVGGVMMGFAVSAVISLLLSHAGKGKDRDVYES
ncbi:MAG: rhomboid family intramembrane serine protease [Clostridiales bacterium]|nr:rhomboid family intramembrane serine protease [Clostridiales bacterium]